MVLLNFLFFVLFGFLNNHLLISGEKIDHHDTCNEKENFEATASNRTKTVVLASPWSYSSTQTQIAPDLRDHQEPPFPRSPIPCQDQSHNGQQGPMEMCRLPAAAEAHSGVLPSVPDAMADYYGPDVRPQSGTATRCKCILDARLNHLGRPTRLLDMEQTQVQEQNSHSSWTTPIQECNRSRTRRRQRTSSTTPCLSWQGTRQDPNAAHFLPSMSTRVSHDR